MVRTVECHRKNDKSFESVADLLTPVQMLINLGVEQIMAKSKRTTAIDRVLDKLSIAAIGGEEIEGMTKAAAIRGQHRKRKI